MLVVSQYCAEHIHELSPAELPPTIRVNRASERHGSESSEKMSRIVDCGSRDLSRDVKVSSVHSFLIKSVFYMCPNGYSEQGPRCT